MSRWNSWRMGCLAAAGLWAFVPVGCQTRAGEGIETSSKEVAMDEIPAAAKATLLKEAGKNQIRELEEKVVDGKTVYEASWVIGDKEIEVVVAPDGRVVNRKTEDLEDEKGKQDQGDKAWRSTFDVDKKDLASTGRNPYFILVPGYKLHLAKGDELVVISVLDETKVVDGVETRVVEERESVGGKLVEISRNYYAIHRKTGDVYYFGEDVDDYKDGKVTGYGGAWLSGVNGARFGLGLPGDPKVGDKYYQEFAPKAAMDRGEVVDLKATLQTPLKTFTDCLYVRETSALESGTSHKWYAKGVGMIGDDSLRLIKIEAPKE